MREDATLRPDTVSGIRRFVPLALLALGFGAFFALGLDSYISLDQLREHRGTLQQWVAEGPVAAALIYILIYAVLTALSVPGGLLLTIAGGFLFGALAGTTCAVLGATVGAVAVFLAARSAFGDFLRRRVKAGMVRRMEEGFRRNALSYLLVLRLVPLFPFWMVNLVPAFLGVRLRTYVIGTFLGIIPGGFVYASVGNGLGAVFDAGAAPDLGIIFEPAILIPIVGLALLSLVPVGYRLIRNRHSGDPTAG
ncbi:MAG: TVP38/TMEM64 family protein [Proteobacteria bacterium]|nr:TVP38/TMEM64 family protein [Pseudomonadota bacterium]